MKNITFFDGHNDTLLALYLPSKSKGRTFFKESIHGHIDLPRMKKSNFFGGFFAIFVPNDPNGRDINTRPIFQNETSYEYEMEKPIEHKYALKFTKNIIRSAREIERQSGGEVKIVESFQDIKLAINNKNVAMLLHLEGAEAVSEDLSNLPELIQLGVRSIGIVWSRNNCFGHGVPFKYPSSPDIGPGLTDSGRELIKVCNEQGILIDMAHLNEKGFWDAAKISTKPLVVTHAAANSVTATARNLTDRQLDAIAESNGVVGLTLALNDIRGEGSLKTNTPLSQYFKHFDYLVERVGVDHVAFGSDFDGARISDEIKDVCGLKKLVEYFSENGYDKDSLEKISHKNWLRVLQSTIR